ncbi:MAG: hypothetical protein ACKPKO_15685, partial [Candidatus Fonsibacter sp.]
GVMPLLYGRFAKKKALNVKLLIVVQAMQLGMLGHRHTVKSFMASFLWPGQDHIVPKGPGCKAWLY